MGDTWGKSSQVVWLSPNLCKGILSRNKESKIVNVPITISETSRLSRCLWIRREPSGSRAYLCTNRNPNYIFLPKRPGKYSSTTVYQHSRAVVPLPPALYSHVSRILLGEGVKWDTTALECAVPKKWSWFHHPNFIDLETPIRDKSTLFFKNRSFTSFTPNKLVNYLFLKNEV